jgi:PAS domain-containing protein
MTKLAEPGTGAADVGTPDGPPASVSAERALLRAVFQNAPAPLFLLEADGTIRRANGKAGDLIGAPPGYATGRPLTAFVDLPGDLLFFYSDGVTEARSADMRFFEERLADELAGLAGRSAAETTRMVQSLVATFSAEDLRDDVTILVAKVTSPAAGA